jgi:hypothetical protein
VTPKKGRPLKLALIGRQKRSSRVCREGKTGTNAVTSSARRGALAMWDVAAWITYHIARANVKIGVVRHDSHIRPHREPLITGYARNPALRLRSQAKVTVNCSHGGVLTLAGSQRQGTRARVDCVGRDG